MALWTLQLEAGARSYTLSIDTPNGPLSVAGGVSDEGETVAIREFIPNPYVSSGSVFQKYIMVDWPVEFGKPAVSYVPEIMD